MNDKLLLVNGIEAKDIRTPGSYNIVDSVGNIVYVGSSCNLYERYSAHKRKLFHGTHENKYLQELNNSYGNLTFIPNITINKEEALLIEQEYLNINIGNSVLCNISKNAKNPQKGLTRSESTKAELSAISSNWWSSLSEEEKIEHSKKISNGLQNYYINGGTPPSLGSKQSSESIAKRVSKNTGLKRTAEFKQFLSELKKGNQYALGYKKTEEAKNKISLANGFSITINNVSYQSFNNAARILNISPTTVMNRCNSDKFPDWKINE